MYQINELLASAARTASGEGGGDTRAKSRKARPGFSYRARCSRLFIHHGGKRDNPDAQGVRPRFHRGQGQAGGRRGQGRDRKFL